MVVKPVAPQHEQVAIQRNEVILRRRESCHRCSSNQEHELLVEAAVCTISARCVVRGQQPA